MTGLNANVANGTCYIAYNQAAGSELVPCGNAGIANVPCCFGGDYCDSSNTCYDNDTGSTYLAGCTDPEYTDASCPWKSDEFADQEWVGLTRCDAINETADEWPWAGCSVPASASTALQRLKTCGCDGKATLFIDGQALLRHASVPETAGGSISWVKGYAVTAAATTSAEATAEPSGSSPLSSSSSAGTAGTGSAGSAAAAATATGTGAGAGAGGTSSGGSLSAGAKAGIAVGSVGAVLSVLAIAVMMFLHRRSRRRKADDAGGGTGGDGGDNPPTGPGGQAQGQAEAVQSVEDASGGVPPPAYSGFKTELPADESAMPKSMRSPSIRPGFTPEMSQSEFGDRPMSMVSGLSSSTEGGERSRLGSPVYPVMASICELQG